MDLPLLLQMELELSVAAHKRDLKEAFDKARERLGPPEKQRANDAAWIQSALMNSASPYWWSAQTGSYNMAFRDCVFEPGPYSLLDELFGYGTSGALFGRI